jgi:hypothetical protein
MGGVEAPKRTEMGVGETFADVESRTGRTKNDVNVMVSVLTSLINFAELFANNCRFKITDCDAVGISITDWRHNGNENL